MLLAIAFGLGVVVGTELIIHENCSYHWQKAMVQVVAPCVADSVAEQHVLQAMRQLMAKDCSSWDCS